MVSEAADSEGSAFGAFYEVVYRLGGSVGDAGVVPVGDGGVRAGQGAAQAAQPRQAVGIAQIGDEFRGLALGEFRAVEATEIAEALLGMPHQAHVAVRIAGPSRPRSLASPGSLRRSWAATSRRRARYGDRLCGPPQAPNVGRDRLWMYNADGAPDISPTPRTATSPRPTITSQMHAGFSPTGGLLSGIGACQPRFWSPRPTQSRTHCPHTFDEPLTSEQRRQSSSR